MKIRYILYEYQAKFLSEKYNFEINNGEYIGIMGHKIYSSFISNKEGILSVKKNTALPLSFGIQMRTEILPFSYEEKMREIIKEYINEKVNIRPQEIEIIKYYDSILFYPIINDEYIYLNDDERCLFIFDISPFLGRGLISGSEFTPMILSKQRSFYDIKEYEKIYTYNIDMELYVSKQEIKDRNDIINYDINRFNETGMVIIKINKIYPVYSYIASEISYVWGLKQIVSSNETIYFSEESILENSQGYDFKNWMLTSIERLFLNKSPLIKISGDWNDIKDDDIKLKIIYIAKLAFKEGIKNNPYLSLVEDDLYVDESLVIHIPVWGPDDMEIITSSLKRLSNNMINYHVHYVDPKEDIHNILSTNINSDPMIIENRIVSISDKLLEKSSNNIKHQIENNVDLLPSVDYGNIILNGNIWYVELEDGNIKELVYLENNPEDSENIIKSNWKKGKFLTNWGGYLKDFYNINSVILTKNILEIQ